MIARKRQSAPLSKQLIMLFALVVPGLLIGCSARLSDVTGKVVINDKAAPPGLKITFTPQDGKGDPILSATDTEGRYRLIHRSGRTGIRPGTYLVSLGFWSDQETNPPELSSLNFPPDVREGTSTLVCVVHAGGMEFDINVRTR